MSAAATSIASVPKARALSLLVGLVMGAAACAAVPVVESRGQARLPQEQAAAPEAEARQPPDARPPSEAGRRQAPTRRSDSDGAVPSAPPVASTEAGSASAGSLVFEVQELRRQVQELRGLLEEQDHRLQRMESEQRERYLDVDRRLRPGASREAPARTPDADAADESPVANADRDSANNTDADERAAYAKALQLMRDKNYQAAIAAFNQQLTDYPGGEFEANCFYWLGELYLALPKPQLERARQSFAQVVNLYPENSKVADAMYKLAVVYERLGDAKKARDYMLRVRNDYPGSPSAGLADAYLLAHDR